MTENHMGSVAQGAMKPPYPTNPEDKKLAADWYTWGFQAGMEAEKRGAARDAAAQPPAAPVETEAVAWIAFAGNGNIRFWTANEARAGYEKARGLDMRAFTLAELVALVSKVPHSPCSAVSAEAAIHNYLKLWDSCGGSTAVAASAFADARQMMRDAIDPNAETFSPADAWNELVHKDDRTSPEEYPDMCLISFDELKDYMERHTGAQPQAANKPVAFVPVHPRQGQLWSDTFAAGSEVHRSNSYPRMALYSDPPQEAPVSQADSPEPRQGVLLNGRYVELTGLALEVMQSMDKSAARDRKAAFADGRRGGLHYARSVCGELKSGTVREVIDHLERELARPLPAYSDPNFEYRPETGSYHRIAEGGA